jgi:hypothetical protein
VTGGVDPAPAAQILADGGDLFAGDGDVGGKTAVAVTTVPWRMTRSGVGHQVGHGVIVVPSARAAKFPAG